ncbi:hypothetical protein [Paenibacillus urinalis]|uniref:hypothetical protein n=1 Tax=Paenibacillus urinalis TaxID=521520 RepID=UPI00196067B9
MNAVISSYDGQRLLIAYNLHKKCLSIRDYQTKRVIDYRACIVLCNVNFIVHQKGRERVLKERKKNLHAFISGYYYADLQSEIKEVPKHKAYYNPYKTKSFVNKETMEVLRTAKRVYCAGKNIYYDD